MSSHLEPNDPPNPAAPARPALSTHVKNALRAALTLLPKNAEDDSGSEGLFDNARSGKVARLPATVREAVNQMLHDNVPYSAIIQTLADLGHPGLLPCNLSRWRARGFVNWLALRQQTEEIKAHQAWAQNLVDDLRASPDPQNSQSQSRTPASKLSDALELVVTNQLLGALFRFSSSDFERDENREFLPRLLSSVNNHFRERTRYQKLQLALRQHEEKQTPQNDPAPAPHSPGATPG